MEGAAALKMPSLERFQGLDARVPLRHDARKGGRLLLRHGLPPGTVPHTLPVQPSIRKRVA